MSEQVTNKINKSHQNIKRTVKEAHRNILSIPRKTFFFNADLKNYWWAKQKKKLFDLGSRQVSGRLWLTAYAQARALGRGVMSIFLVDRIDVSFVLVTGIGRRE